MKADTETVDVRPRLHFELFDLHLAAVIDDAIAAFIASVSPDIPLHVTRFFPR